MDTDLIPGKGEKCLNCAERATRNARFVKRFKEKGQALFDKFLSQENPEDLFSWDSHVEKRAREKLFDPQELFSIIENGWVIKRDDETEVVVMAYKKIGTGEYLAFHAPMAIVEMRDGKYTAFVKTVYFPQVSAHLWNSTFELRVCWCQPYDMGEAGVL